MSGFEFRGDGVRGVAASMREGSEQAAQAGVALAGLGAGLPTPAAGLRLDSALDAVSASWSDVLDDMVAGLAQLATWMDDAAAVTEHDDDSVWDRFLGIFR